MTHPKPHNGLTIGAIFTLCSLLLTFTFFIPIISVLPGVVFETISKAIISNTPYSNVGKLTILFLTVAIFLTIILSLWHIKKQTIEHHSLPKVKVVGIMTVFYFIVHPLGFYIYCGLKLNFRNDGQLIFAAVDSFPISSFSFVFFGLLLDWARNTAAKKALLKAERGTILL
jgi:hypothetical protein